MNWYWILSKSRLLLVGALFGALAGMMGGLASVSVDRLYWGWSIYEFIFCAKIASCFGALGGAYIMFRPFGIYRLILFSSIMSLLMVNLLLYLVNGPDYYLESTWMVTGGWLFHILPLTIASSVAAYFSVLKLAFPLIDYYRLDEMPKRSKSSKIIL
jgi:hypothetical protein